MITLLPEHFTKRYVLYTSENIVYTINYDKTIARSLFGDNAHNFIVRRFLPRCRKIGGASIPITIAYWLLIIVNQDYYNMIALLVMCFVGEVYMIASLLALQTDLTILSLQCFEIVYLFIMTAFTMITLGELLDWPSYVIISLPYLLLAYSNIYLSDAWPTSSRYFEKNVEQMVGSDGSRILRKDDVIDQAQAEHQKADRKEKDENQSDKKQQQQEQTRTERWAEIVSAPSRFRFDFKATEQMRAETKEGRNDVVKVHMTELSGNAAAYSESPPGRKKENRDERCEITDKRNEDKEKNENDARIITSDSEFFQGLCGLYGRINRYADDAHFPRSLMRRIFISQSLGVPQMVFFGLGAACPICLYTIFRWEYATIVGDKPIPFLADFMTTRVIFFGSCVNMIAFTFRRIFIQLYYPYKILCIKQRPLRIPLIKEWLPIIEHMQQQQPKHGNLNSSDVSLSGVASNANLFPSKAHSNDEVLPEGLSRKECDIVEKQEHTYDSSLLEESVRKVPSFDSKNIDNKKLPELVQSSSNQKLNQANIDEGDSGNMPLQTKTTFVKKCSSSTLVSALEKSQIEFVSRDNRNKLGLTICPLNDDVLLNFEDSIFDFLTGGNWKKQYPVMAKKATKYLGIFPVICMFTGPLSFIIENNALSVVYDVIYNSTILFYTTSFLTYSYQGVIFSTMSFDSGFILVNCLVMSYSAISLLGGRGIRAYFAAVWGILSVLMILYFDNHPVPTFHIKKHLLNYPRDEVSHHGPTQINKQLSLMAQLISSKYVTNEIRQHPQNGGSVLIFDISSLVEFWSLSDILNLFRRNVPLYQFHPVVVIPLLLLCILDFFSLFIIFQSDLVYDASTKQIPFYIIDFDNQVALSMICITFVIFFSKRLWSFFKQPMRCMSLERRSVRIPLFDGIERYFPNIDAIQNS